MRTILFIASGIFMLNACNSSGTAESTLDATKIEQFVEPVAEFMASSKDVQLFSFFDSNFKEEPATLEARFETTGAMGADPAIFMKAFTVEGETFAPYVLVSEADKHKVMMALDQLEIEGKPEEVNVVFKGTLVADGSDQSPFSDEIRLRFAKGKVIAIE